MRRYIDDKYELVDLLLGVELREMKLIERFLKE
jgi:hypothetical protein